MIKKLFNRKKTANKQGSMLTLVLVIMAMALILITSAIAITNSTRRRYIDYTLSSQARTTVTSVAEFMCNAIKTQDLLDSNLEDYADNEISATVSADIPGANGASGSKTTVKFSHGEGTEAGYIYMDVSCTIGNATENVRVYLKKKEVKPSKINLFSNMMEGNILNFGGLNVATSAPSGAKNTIFVHGNINLTSQAGNTIGSDLYITGRLTAGNQAVEMVVPAEGGGTKTIKGYENIVFFGKDAGLNGGGGNFVANNVYFISLGSKVVDENTGVETWTDQGKAFGTDGNYQDGKIGTAYFYNFDVNGKLGQNNETDFWYRGAEQATNNVTVNSAIGDSYSNKVTTAFTNTAANSNMAANLKAMVEAAEDAAKNNSKYVPLDTAKKEFFEGISDTYFVMEVDAQDRDGDGDTEDLVPVLDADGLPTFKEEYIHEGVYGESSVKLNTPGVYTLASEIKGLVEVNLSAGPIILKVVDNTKIFTSQGGSIEFTGGGSSIGTWGRIIISADRTLTVGDASTSDLYRGIVAVAKADHEPYKGKVKDGANLTNPYDPYLVPKEGSKPTLFIFGLKNANLTVDHSGTYLEAYIGLYDGSTMSISGKPILAGRISAPNIVTKNTNGAELLYTPEPIDGKPTGMTKKESDYEVKRFRYFY